MTVLIVSSFPPMRCGVGTYAAQQAERLRGEGCVVDVLSPPEGDGDFQAELAGGLRPLRLLKYAWAYRRVFIHYVPNFYFSSQSRWSRFFGSLALLTVLLIHGRRIHFVIHETDYQVDRPEDGRTLRTRIDRWTWRMAAGIRFHSVRERDAFARRYRLKPARPQFEIIRHGSNFIPFSRLSPEEARRSLDIPPDKILFLCIGFVQPHKGFERPVEAMRRVDSPNALVRVVGSVRINWPPALEYAEKLHRLCAGDPRCEFIETYVDDELFDRWIIAADYVVAPYRNIWSSSVVARAAMHGRPVIGTDSGGLVEQLPENSCLFKNDEELSAIMNRIAEAHAASTAATS